MTHSALDKPRWAKDVLRWGAAGLVVTAAHAGVTYAAIQFAPATSPPAFEEAMVVDLAPMVVSEAEPVPELDTVEEERPEQLAAIEEEQPVTPEEQPEAVEETPPEEVVEDTPEETEVAEEEPQETVEETPEVKKAEVVLPKPVKKKAPPKKRVEKPKPVEKKTDVVEKKPLTRSQQAKAGASVSRAPVAEISRWKSQVQAAVNRRKPRGRGVSGRAIVRFVVSSSGSVLSASVSRSSGETVLDEAALGMVRGARIPAAPAGTPATTAFSVPVTFQ